MNPKPLKPQLGYLVLGSVCLLASVLLGWTSYAHRLNNLFYDLYFRQRGPRQPSAEIAIVAVDDATLSAFGPLPLNRSALAQGIAALRRAQPSVIAIDLLLTDAGNPDSDRELAEALGGATPQNLPLLGGAMGATQNTPPGADANRPNSTNQSVGRPPIILATAMATQGGTWLRPRPEFAVAAAAIGHVHADPDPDGITRQVLLEKRADQQRYWALALETFRLWLRHSPAPITETDEALQLDTRAGPIQVPATRQRDRSLLIDYAGGNGTFPQISFASLINDPSAAERLKSKIVLVGVTAQASGDRLFTPFSAGMGMAGVEIHANLLNTILSGAYLVPVPDSKALLGMFAVVLATVWGFARLQGYYQLAWLIGVGVIALGAPYSRFLEGQVWPGFSILLAYGSTITAGEVYQVFVVGKRFRESERRRAQSQQRFEMAAHEMRTPLAAIQASSELLARYALNGERREQMVQMLYEESQRLGRLVERFLSVERFSAGEMELRRARVELRPLLASVCERLRHVAARKNIRLILPNEDSGSAIADSATNSARQFAATRVSEGAEPLTIEADAELLEFAISNLVTNAIKYSPEGTSVSIGWEKHGPDARIHITDSGPGLTPEESQHIFERFYRTQGAERSSNPGFGLGLSIAREIARHHGGDLRVESKPGAGCRFTLSLPLQVPSEARKVVTR